MRTHILFVVLALIATSAFAAINEYVPVDYSSAFRVTNGSSGQMNIRFTLPDYTLENVTVGDKQFQKVHIKDAGHTLDDGLPQLPFLTLTIAIPRRGAPQLSLANTQTQVISNINAYPVQEGMAEENPKGFVYNADFYHNNTLYPQSPLVCGEPYILRDFRLISIQVNPFSYNASMQELTVNESMEFVLGFVDQPSVNEMDGEFTGYSPSFRKVYEANIHNFAQYRHMARENQPPRYLIIYGGSNHDQAFQNALNNFALWKRQKGADVDLASTAVSEAGSSTTSIKNYIQARYNNPLTRPDFIILLGDTQGSYTVPCFIQDNGASDYNYTHLAGNDQIGDAMIGRISVENFAQLQTLFAKIYLYERDLNMATAEWLNRMLLVGDASHSGLSCIYINKYIKQIALKVNPAYDITEVYSSPFPSSMDTAINQGVGFFSYRGWVYISGWSPSESLSNSYKLLHAVFPTCYSGIYSGSGIGTSEAFIRLGSATVPKGAVTATGMSNPTNISTRTMTNNALVGGTFGGIFSYGMRTMGEAILNGRTFLTSTYGTSYASTVSLQAAWYNLMGDPTMEVYCSKPDTFSVTAPTTIRLGDRLMDVVALNGALEPVAESSVTLSQGQSILSRGYTDVNGVVTLLLPTVMNATDCVLTISKHNFKPVQITITVDASGTLTPGIFLVDDDNNGQSQGNADGMPNAGETIELMFGINNTKAEAINGVNGYLSCDSPYVTIADNTITFGNIPAGEMSLNSPVIVMQIANDIPNKTFVRFTLHLTDNQNNQYQVIDQLMINNAQIMYHSYMVVDAGTNNVLDPGETGGLRVTVSNIGAQGLTNVYGRLYSDNDLVSVVSSAHTVFYGDLLQNIQVIPMDEAFGLNARAQVLPGMTIPMRMKLYNDSGFEQWVYFSFTVGNVTMHDPLGPDEYGYVIYDDGDVIYPGCPIYDWVGIAPAEGGIGTALPITDSYVAGNEGDQVSSNSLAVVTLPFPFQFYGIAYNQITVSSNGFLVFGVNEDGAFRNYRLPGPMAPGPMIAPFWDDLATHTGSGIYTLFDRSNHAFIIEWYNLRNGSNGTSPETFQVILYDPAVHAGSMGDGPIKIQYHTFNNVDATTSIPGKHGRHATIGIQNEMGNIGLEYSFANTYPTAASPLGNNRALYITNVPIHYEAPHMVIGETHVSDTNGNGVCEPGETINLGVKLSNIGNTVADQLMATLSTINPYVTVVQDTASYHPIEGEDSGYNRTYFVFTISEDCPDGTVVEFDLDIADGEDGSWSRPFSLRVDTSHMEYLGFLINDADANYNGVIEPMENIKLAINVKNNSAVETRNLQATLSSSDPDIIIGDPIIMKESVDPNDIIQLVYDLQFNISDPVGSYKSLQFNVSTDNGQPMSTTIMVPFNMNNIFSDFETENGGFIPETGWAWGTPTQPGVTPFSGTKLWTTTLSGYYPGFVTWDLYTPVYALQTGSQLKFMHRYGFRNAFDGGNIAISTDNGNTWSVLTPIGGYTHNYVIGLEGQPGFSGFLSIWQQVVFDLSNYANQMVMFRFRLGTDSSNGSLGWFIDDFELSGVDQKTGYISGTVNPTSGADVTKANVRANTFYSTNPDETGLYTLYLPNGTHNITASLLYHQSSTVNDINISPAEPSYTQDFTLVHLPAPGHLGFVGFNETGTVILSWEQPQDPVYQVLGYNLYKRFNTGPFVRYQDISANDTTFVDQISLHGEYKYYVTAKYLNTEGEPTNVVAFSFPLVSNGENEVPTLVTKLAQNYPNPFNPTTTISFDLAKAGKVKLNIYNIKGQLVRSLVNEDLYAGNHKVIWNGTDGRNRRVASGIYCYRLETKDFSKTNKMVLMK